MTIEQKSRPYANKGDLTTGNITRHLMRLSIPMIWGILAIIAVQLVDTYFVARLGTETLAAFSFTMPVTYFVFTLIMGFGIAMSSVISRLIGQGEHDTVQRVVTHGMILVFGVNMVIAALGVMFQGAIFDLLGASAKTQEILHSYMLIWFVGVFALSLPLVGNAAMRAGGDTFLPAMIMTLSAVINAILDPIFIFGWAGMPEMGLYGAGLATVMANLAAMGSGLYALSKKDLVKAHFIRDMRAFKDSAKRLLLIALPAGITNSLVPLSGAVITAILAHSGSEAVAAFGVASRVESLAFVVLMGLSVGMAPVIGQNFGAGLMPRVRETIQQAMSFNVLWSLGVAGVLWFFAGEISALFSDDPIVIYYAKLFFWIVPFSYAMSNLVNGWVSVFNAMGQPKYSVMMIFGKMICVMIPAVIIGNDISGPIGVFVAIAIVNVIAGLVVHFFGWRLCRKKA